MVLLLLSKKAKFDCKNAFLGIETPNLTVFVVFCCFNKILKAKIKFCDIKFFKNGLMRLLFLKYFA